MENEFNINPEASEYISRRDFLKIARGAFCISLISAIANSYPFYQQERNIASLRSKNVPQTDIPRNHFIWGYAAALLAFASGWALWGLDEEKMNLITQPPEPEDDDVVVEALMSKSGSKDQIR